MKIVAADVAIPIESRKMVKLRIWLNLFAKNSTIIQTAANTVRLTVSTSFFSSFFLNDAGRIPSSLIAYITLGLLSNKTFTYANTATNNRMDEIYFPVGPNNFSATMAAMP